jgi:hypothetical protein
VISAFPLLHEPGGSGEHPFMGLGPESPLLICGEGVPETDHRTVLIYWCPPLLRAAAVTVRFLRKNWSTLSGSSGASVLQPCRGDLTLPGHVTVAFLRFTYLYLELQFPAGKRGAEGDREQVEEPGTVKFRGSDPQRHVVPFFACASVMWKITPVSSTATGAHGIGPRCDSLIIESLAAAENASQNALWPALIPLIFDSRDSLAGESEPSFELPSYLPGNDLPALVLLSAARIGELPGEAAKALR